MDNEIIKKKYGRKKKTPEQKRSIEVKVRFTEEEYKSILSKMERTSIKEPATYLYELIKSKNNSVTFVPEINEKLLTEINKQGANINQIAKIVNSTKGTLANDILIKIEFIRGALISIRNQMLKIHDR